VTTKAALSGHAPYFESTEKYTGFDSPLDIELLSQVRISNGLEGKVGRRMNWGKFHLCQCLLMVACVPACLVAQAVTIPRVAGSYEVLHQSDAAGQTQVRIQLHLVNRGGGDLRIQRITLWDFSHPMKGGTQACSLVIHSASSADTKQEFTIPRAEYALWRRGAKPRLVLEVTVPGGHSGTEVVSLERASSGKGN